MSSLISSLYSVSPQHVLQWYFSWLRCWWLCWKQSVHVFHHTWIRWSLLCLLHLYAQLSKMCQDFMFCDICLSFILVFAFDFHFVELCHRASWILSKLCASYIGPNSAGNMQGWGKDETSKVSEGFKDRKGCSPHRTGNGGSDQDQNRALGCALSKCVVPVSLVSPWHKILPPLSADRGRRLTPVAPRGRLPRWI